MSDKKGGFVYLFLSLSFSHFTMIHKKRTCLLSVQMGTDISNYGKVDTFESIYRYLYLLVIITFNRTLLLSTVVYFYMQQQWKWKSTGILSFLQKKAKEHKALDCRHVFEQAYSL
jgi:hypothetical protein